MKETWNIWSKPLVKFVIGIPRKTLEGKYKMNVRNMGCGDRWCIKLAGS
jgi:hypothetical protein